MKLFKMTLLALCAFAFLACSSTPSPTEVFKAQNEAQKKKDAAAMKQNLSKGSLELIEKAAKTQNKTVDEALTADSPMGNKDAEYEFRNEKTDGDNASVEIKEKGKDQWVTMPFVKEDGKWKLALDKLMQDLMKKMTEDMKVPTAPSSNTNSANK